MIRYFGLLAPVILLLAACDRSPDGPPIVISDVRILAPLAGSDTGVAYLSISNSSDMTITVTGARSPQFTSVEMHETTLVNDVMRMRKLDRVVIGAGETVLFEEGGRHMMLLGPGPGALPGSPVTLEIQHDGGLLIVSATMQVRQADE